MPLSFCVAPEDDCCGSPIMNACMHQGETVAYQLQFFSNGSTPLDLTDFYFKMTIEFPDPLILETEGTAGQDLEIVDAEEGILQINISNAISEALQVGEFPYDIFGVDSGGAAKRYFGGTWKMKQSETFL